VEREADVKGLRIEDGEPTLAEQAAQMLESAANTQRVFRVDLDGSEWTSDDPRVADREATIGLGLAMLDLAAALRETGRRR
jgi:hypothetical protein